MGKFERLLLELNVIKGSPGIKTSELAERAGISSRTIYRDILSLSQAHIPVYYENGYRILKTAFLPTLNLTVDEARVLRLALSCPSLKRRDYAKIVKSLLAKIDTTLDSNTKSMIRSLSDVSQIKAIEHFTPSRLFPSAEILEQAIQKCRKVRLTYDSINSGRRERTVHPYSLIFREVVWYLLGFCELRGDFRLFKLCRIKKITLLDQGFDKDPKFSVDKFFENRWQMLGGELHRVKVKFTGSAARCIESTPHHPKEEITKQKDGSVIYSLVVEGLEEIARWILTFGKEAIVLEPEELKKKIIETSHGILAQYYQSIMIKPAVSVGGGPPLPPELRLKLHFCANKCLAKNFSIAP